MFGVKNSAIPLLYFRIDLSRSRRCERPTSRMSERAPQGTACIYTRGGWGSHGHTCGQHVRWNTSSLAEQYTGKVGCALAVTHSREIFCSATACFCNNADQMEITTTTLDRKYIPFVHDDTPRSLQFRPDYMAVYFRIVCTSI